jgi:hypothetical protein
MPGKTIKFTTLLVLLCVFASAQSIPAGTKITVRSSSELSSATAKSGQKWDGVLAQDLLVHGKTIAKSGDPVRGTVSSAKPSGRLHAPGLLTVRLSSVQVGGRSVPVQTSSFHVAGKDQTKSSVLKAGGGTAAGALIGGLAGGGKGAAIGALAGAGAGTGLAAATGKREAVIRAESVMTFTTTSPSVKR